jgi:uncharacterized membrane protein
LDSQHPSVLDAAVHDLVVTPGGTFNVTMEPLALPPGIVSGVSLSINERGEMAGFGFMDDDRQVRRALMWRADGTPVDLSGACETPASAAYGINARGQVAGWCVNAAGNTDAVVWTGARVQVLPRLEGYDDALAYGIDARGDVFGENQSGAAAVAVVWPRGRDPVIVGSCPTSRCIAYDGAFDRFVIGEAAIGGLTERGVLWQRSISTTLHAPPGLGATKTVAFDVDGELGIIVGAVLSDLNRSLVRAVTWDFQGTPAALPMHGGRTPLEAGAISADGLIVGFLQDPSFHDDGYVWSAATGYVLLPQPPASLGARAFDIANSGWIAGWYYATPLHDAPIRWHLERIE